MFHTARHKQCSPRNHSGLAEKSPETNLDQSLTTYNLWMSLVRMLPALRSVPAIYPKETGVANGSPMIKIWVAVVRTMPSPSGADQARLAATLSVNAPFSLPHVGRLILRESMTRLVFVPADENARHFKRCSNSKACS